MVKLLVKNPAGAAGLPQAAPWTRQPAASLTGQGLLASACVGQLKFSENPRNCLLASGKTENVRVDS
jgi:hypothetical protein